MKRFLALSALLSSLVLSAAAQTPLGTDVLPSGLKAPIAPDDLPAGTYTVDTKETLVRYGVNHEGFSEFWGTFPGATGTLTIDPKNIAATKLDVKVPIALVETTNRELNGELFSDEFFDGEKHPYMHFVSTEAMRTGPTTAKITGNLSMHNITKQVTLDVTFVGAGPNPFDTKDGQVFVGFRAVGMVNRSDFGMGEYVPIVSDGTTITISAAFVKKPAG